jgi:hypothetical protein
MPIIPSDFSEKFTCGVSRDKKEAMPFMCHEAIQDVGK